MYDLRIFNNEEYGEVSVIIENNKEYFEATKIAKILGYKNPHNAINTHCKKEGVAKRSVGVSTGAKSDGSNTIQYVDKKFIDESNLYRLIIKSKLPNAKKFESWVVEEVLPSIRKNGAYITNKLIEEMVENLDLIIKLINSLKEHEEYINIGKVVGECEDAISIGAFAKLLNNIGIDIGRNRLFIWFRNNGYIMKQNLENQPKQKYIEQGLFKIREFYINTNHGPKLVITPYITGKGQKYFVKIIKEEYKNETTYKYH